MSNATEILARKSARGGCTLMSVDPDVTVLEAVRVMNERHIGSVVVTDHAGRLAGIFTERDLLTRVVAERLAPERTRVRDVMTRRVVCCEPGTSIEELRTLMHEKRVRHVPVIDDNRPIGLVSIGDVNAVREEDLEQTVQYLELYLRS